MNSISRYCLSQSCIAMLSCCLLFSCNNADSSKAEEPVAVKDTQVVEAKLFVLDKLTGVWQNTDGKSFERWSKNDNGSYRSAGFSVKGTDTSWNEMADVYQQNGKWIFANNVKGQNDGKTVEFVSSLVTENSIQFSNPAHDFPTDINYTVADDSTVNAFIVGPGRNGGKDTIPFNFKRWR